MVSIRSLSLSFSVIFAAACAGSSLDREDERRDAWLKRVGSWLLEREGPDLQAERARKLVSCDREDVLPLDIAAWLHQSGGSSDGKVCDSVWAVSAITYEASALSFEWDAGERCSLERMLQLARAARFPDDVNAMRWEEVTPYGATVSVLSWRKYADYFVYCEDVEGEGALNVLMQCNSSDGYRASMNACPWGQGAAEYILRLAACTVSEKRNERSDACPPRPTFTYESGRKI
jgi:hypothetical protein